MLILHYELFINLQTYIYIFKYFFSFYSNRKKNINQFIYFKMVSLVFLNQILSLFYLTTIKSIVSTSVSHLVKKGRKEKSQNPAKICGPRFDLLFRGHHSFLNFPYVTNISSLAFHEQTDGTPETWFDGKEFRKYYYHSWYEHYHAMNLGFPSFKLDAFRIRRSIKWENFLDDQFILPSFLSRSKLSFQILGIYN